MNFLIKEFKNRYFDDIIKTINNDVSNYVFKSDNDGLLVNNYISYKFISFLQSEGFDGDGLIEIYSNNINSLYFVVANELKELGYNVGLTIKSTNNIKETLVFIYKSKVKSVIGTLISNVPFIKSLIAKIV